MISETISETMSVSKELWSAKGEECSRFTELYIQSSFENDELKEEIKKLKKKIDDHKHISIDTIIARLKGIDWIARNVKLTEENKELKFQIKKRDDLVELQQNEDGQVNETYWEEMDEENRPLNEQYVSFEGSCLGGGTEGLPD